MAYTNAVSVCTLEANWGEGRYARRLEKLTRANEEIRSPTRSVTNWQTQKSYATRNQVDNGLHTPTRSVQCSCVRVCFDGSVLVHTVAVFDFLDRLHRCGLCAHDTQCESKQPNTYLSSNGKCQHPVDLVRESVAHRCVVA